MTGADRSGVIGAGGSGVTGAHWSGLTTARRSGVTGADGPSVTEAGWSGVTTADWSRVTGAPQEGWEVLLSRRIATGRRAERCGPRGGANRGDRIGRRLEVLQEMRAYWPLPWKAARLLETAGGSLWRRAVEAFDRGAAQGRDNGVLRVFRKAFH